MSGPWPSGTAGSIMALPPITARRHMGEVPAGLDHRAAGPGALSTGYPLPYGTD
jgi:hypothetical protein